jgi:hypothetical protein
VKSLRVMDEHRSWVTGEDERGGTDLSGPKLENPEPTCIGPSRTSWVGTGGSWRVGTDRFFFNFTKKENKPPKTPKFLKIPKKRKFPKKIIEIKKFKSG